MSEIAKESITKFPKHVDHIIRIDSEAPANLADEIFQTVTQANPELVQVSKAAPQPILELVPKLRNAGFEVSVGTYRLRDGDTKSC